MNHVYRQAHVMDRRQRVLGVGKLSTIKKYELLQRISDLNGKLKKITQ